MTDGAVDRADDWEQHWERYDESAAANPAQAYRRRLVLRELGRHGAPARVLDIGSGQGDMLAAVSAAFPAAALAGVELSAAGVRVAGAKVPGAAFVQRDLLAPGQPPPSLAGWATHAVCSEVLEHVEHPAALLVGAAPFMAPGCRLVVTVPGGPMSAFDRHIGHRTHYVPDQLAGVLSEAGLRVERIDRAGFPFFNLYRRIVVARGDRLVDDVDRSQGGSLPLSARVAMAGFGVAFRANLADTRWGTQLLAVARLP